MEDEGRPETSSEVQDFSFFSSASKVVDQANAGLDGLEGPTARQTRRLGAPVDLVMTGRMARLATPWRVCQYRADSAGSISGLIVDAACGTGLQLAAYQKKHQTPVVGIELNPTTALCAAANLFLLNEMGEGSVLVGDGTDAKFCISRIVDEGVHTIDGVGLLHLDPARPLAAGHSPLDELQPQLKPLLTSWGSLDDYLKPSSLILDLPPRLTIAQRAEVEQMVREELGVESIIWEWLSQGEGRVDRLALLGGDVATKGLNAKAVRLFPDGKSTSISGSTSLVQSTGMSKPPSIGMGVTILDPVLVESGLLDLWLEFAGIAADEFHLSLEDERRPLLVHSKRLQLDSEQTRAFIITSGRLLESERDNENNLQDWAVKTVNNHRLDKAIIRQSIPPEKHPRLQAALDSRRAFMLENREGFITRVSSDSGDYHLLCLLDERLKGDE